MTYFINIPFKKGITNVETNNNYVKNLVSGPDDGLLNWMLNVILNYCVNRHVGSKF